MPEHRDPLVHSAVVALLDASPMPPSWEEIEAAATQSLQQKRSVHTGWAVAVAVAVAVILIIAIPTLLFGGGEPTPVDVPSTTIPEVTTTATGTTEAIDGVAPVTSWERVGGEVMDPVVGIFRAARTSDGFIAVGFDPGEEDFRQNGVVFTSTDGVTWARLAEDDPDLLLGGILMYSVTEGGPGYVAVGTGCEDDTAPCPSYPTVWTSVDGTDWNRSGPDPNVFGDSGAMLDVVNTSNHGLVAAGSILTEDARGALLAAPAVWMSSDGLAWERTWVGEAIADSAISPGINAVAEGPAGLLIAVGETRGPGGSLSAGMWRSEDGRVWEQVLDPALASSNGKKLTMLEAAYGPNGFVVVGSEGSADAAIWHSPDGWTWTRIDVTDQPFAGTESLSSVTVTENGYLVSGDHGFTNTTSTHVRLWTSTDGLAWDRILDLGDGYTMSVIATPTVTVLTGAMPFDNNFHASVWTGPAFDPREPPPDPISAADEAAADAAAALRIWAEPPGATCQDLAATGYRYPQVVAYWARYGRQAAMDPDGIGIPCASAYPDSDVAAVFGPDAYADIQIVVEDDVVALSGDAVDEGAMCPSATSRPAEDAVGDPQALWNGENVITCDDGTGTFTIAFDILANDTDAMTDYGTWTVTEGTGDYALLGGGGIVSSGPDEDWWWKDTFTGRVGPRSEPSDS